MASMRSTDRASRTVRHSAITLAIAAAAILLGALYLRGGTSVTPHVVVLHASWAQNYNSVHDLATDADAVVIARVTGIATEGPDVSTPSVLATRFQLAVQRTVKGVPGTSLVVKQTGGTDAGLTQLMEGDPLLVVGDDYLLYLRQVHDGPYAGDYFVLGGPAGRFGVAADGGLTSFGQVSLPQNTTLDSLLP